jgi:hypothetical protein
MVTVPYVMHRKGNSTWNEVRVTVPALVALVLLTASTSAGAVDGIVRNATTGQPAGRVPVTLISFAQGMEPVEEVYTGPDGVFRMEKSLASPEGRPTPGMLRVEYEGASYTKVLPPGTPTTGVEVIVYSVVEDVEVPPEGHIVFFEPGGAEMVVAESFSFSNKLDPPRAVRNPDKGTLRFYLPPEAKGVVEVSASGPAGMPVRSTARKTSEENIYMVDFPIKPGDNRIDLTYVVPYLAGAPFEGRVLYPGLMTRIAVPSGVTIEADNLKSMGQEPRTQAKVYALPAASEYQVTLSGEGRIAPPETAAAEGGQTGGDVRVAPAPVAKELTWLLIVTAAILGVGFYYLYTKPGEQALVMAGAEDAAPAATSRAQQARRGGDTSKTVRRKR